jgi:hypothetical protein
MNDPIPAVAEAEAIGEIADIFADIRNVYRVGVVNLVWRHLATFPGALPWVWESVRPVYVDGTIEQKAAALRASIGLTEVPAFPATALSGAGLSKQDLEQIQAILAAYNRTNAMALIALSAVRCKIAGIAVEIVGAVAPSGQSLVQLQHEIRLPPLLDLAELSPETAELVLKMNRLGARHDASILASMYRHLAHWPAYLALAWTIIAPLDADNRLDRAIKNARARAHASACAIVARLHTPPLTLKSGIQADMSRALDRFAGNVIARMAVIGVLLGRATAAKCNKDDPLSAAEQGSTNRGSSSVSGRSI